MSVRNAVAIESLEHRNLFTAISASHLVLNVIGNAGFANVITVGVSPDGQSIDSTIQWQTRKGPQTLSKSFTIANQIGHVIIRGGAGNDVIVIDQTYSAFPFSTEINAKGGNDTIRSGDERDLIFVSGGHDNVNSGAGDDSIHAMGGKDTIIAGAGNDRILVQTGKNYIDGGDGNDTLRVASGHDTLYGGDGADVFNVVKVKKHPVNDFNSSIDRFKKVEPPPPDEPSLFDDWLKGATWPF